MDMRTKNLIDYLSAAEALEKAHKETDSVMVYLKNGGEELIHPKFHIEYALHEFMDFFSADGEMNSFWLCVGYYILFAGITAIGSTVIFRHLPTLRDVMLDSALVMAGFFLLMLLWSIAKEFIGHRRNKKLYKETGFETAYAVLYEEKLIDQRRQLSELKKRYYDLDIIADAYENSTGVTQLLKVLESGKCSGLKGKNGAYRLIESNAKKGAKQPKAPEPCDVIRILKGEYLKDFDKTIELYEKKYESFRQLKGSNLL